MSDFSWITSNVLILVALAGAAAWLLGVKGIGAHLIGGDKSKPAAPPASPAAPPDPQPLSYAAAQPQPSRRTDARIDALIDSTREMDAKLQTLEKALDRKLLQPASEPAWPASPPLPQKVQAALTASEIERIVKEALEASKSGPVLTSDPAAAEATRQLTELLLQFPDQKGVIAPALTAMSDRATKRS